MKKNSGMTVFWGGYEVFMKPYPELILNIIRDLLKQP